MDAAVTDSLAPAPGKQREEPPVSLSYKFQRLRERIRQAIVSGELSGKLPGERALAGRFHCNAKTLSKALTDLAAEGVLDRSIGRGTFVKGSVPQAVQIRWLLLCDPDEACGELATALREANSDAQVITDSSGVRPSLLNQFGAVVVLSNQVTEEFLRDLSLRNMPVVLINREPGTFSHHAVLLDTGLAGARLCRELLLHGHRRIAVVEPVGATTLAQSIRLTAARYDEKAVVETCTGQKIDRLIDNGFTAIVCSSPATATHLKAHLAARQISCPGDISLAAIGCAGEPVPCSGYFASPRNIAESVTLLFRDTQSARPAALWLAGQWRDAGSIGPARAGAKD